jgi:hypothetical protein
MSLAQVLLECRYTMDLLLTPSDKWRLLFVSKDVSKSMKILRKITKKKARLSRIDLYNSYPMFDDALKDLLFGDHNVKKINPFYICYDKFYNISLKNFMSPFKSQLLAIRIPIDISFSTVKFQSQSFLRIDYKSFKQSEFIKKKNYYEIVFEEVYINIRNFKIDFIGDENQKLDKVKLLFRCYQEFGNKIFFPKCLCKIKNDTSKQKNIHIDQANDLLFILVYLLYWNMGYERASKDFKYQNVKAAKILNINDFSYIDEFVSKSSRQLTTNRFINGLQTLLGRKYYTLMRFDFRKGVFKSCSLCKSILNRCITELTKM